MNDLPASTVVNLRLGEEIRRLRIVKQITMRQFAKMIGVSVPFMSDVEHGRRSIRKRLLEVARILDVEPEHFTKICGVCPTCGGTGTV